MLCFDDAEIKLGLS